MLSIILGAFPSYVVPTNFYRFLLLPTDKANSFSKLYWHNIAAILFIVSIAKNDSFQKFFSKKICLLSSKISFWVYLIHLEVIYFFERFLDNFQNLFSSYLLAILVLFILDAIALLITTILLNKFVSPLGVKIINSLFSRFKLRDETN